MARIKTYTLDSASSFDKFLVTTEEGVTGNLLLSQIEDYILGSASNRRVAVESQIDFTTAEPSFADGERYINSATGTSSTTDTAVTATYIYEARNGVWYEIIPIEGWTLWDKTLDKNYAFDGSAWVNTDGGVAGEGVPVGGTSGQLLAKIDGTNYNTEWITLNIPDNTDFVDLTSIQTIAGAKTFSDTVTIDGSLILKAGTSTYTITPSLTIPDTNNNYTLPSIGGEIASKSYLDIQVNDLNTNKQNILTEGAFVDGDKTKLDGIAIGAEANPDVVPQAEAEAGVATTERIWTAQRVKQAIDALGGAGGVDGLSAYQIAVNGGFVGTEQEWIASLQGEQGIQGIQGIQGVAGNDGANGVDGDSAYEIAVAGGFVGTEAQWLASLVGADGTDGADGAQGIQGEQGIQGIQGLQGDAGAAGADGADGQGVPIGGTTGQILKKVDATDFNTEWADETGGNVENIIVDIEKYATVGDLPAIAGDETDVYAYVTTDTNKDLNGLYCISGGEWKLLYVWSDFDMPIIKTSPNLVNLDYVYGGAVTDSTHEGVIDGYRLDLNATGVVASASQFITDFIPVKEGDYLIFDGNERFWWFDEDKQPLADADVPYNYGDDFYIDNPNVKYIRWTCSIANKGVSGMIVRREKDALTTPSGWQDFNEGYERDNTNFVYELDGTIFKKATNNLVDFKKADWSKYYSTTDGPITTDGGSTGFIEIKPNTPYHKSGGNGALAWFDKDKTFISGVTTDFAVSPSNAKYLVWYINRIENLDNWTLEQNITASGEVIKDISSEILKSNISVKKSVCIIGDSIGTEGSTYAQIGYPSLIKNLFNINEFHNVSSSGKALANLRLDVDTMAYAMPTCDLYIIALGTNDFGYNIPLGTLSDTNGDNSVCGAMQSIYEQLLGFNPNAKIVWFTPIQRGTQDTPNAQGAILIEFRDMIIQKADDLGCDYLDLWNCGINVYNSETLTDWFVSGDGTHPNSEGHKAFLYPKISRFVKEIIDSDFLGNDTDTQLSPTIGTGSALEMNNPVGALYNIDAESNATAYTLTNVSAGCFAISQSNASTEPTVTGATKIAGATWVADTTMYLNVSALSATSVFYYWTNNISGVDRADRLYKDAAVTGTLDIDWSLYEIFDLTLTGAVVLSDINLPASGGKTISIRATGEFAITYPTGWDVTFKNGTYDGTVLNEIVVKYVKDTTPYYALQISQPQV